MRKSTFTYLKIVITIGVGSLGLVGSSFAQESTVMQEIVDFVEPILGLLGWIRIIPATVAGELLSNDMVFGEKFNLTTYLWRVWTIMRTFANFFIGALFLYFLFMQIFNSIKGDGLGDFINKILRLLLAAILVNASFFLIRATVDLSIVATTAVSSLPHTVVAKQWDNIKDKVKVKGTNCVIDLKVSTPNCDQTKVSEVGISQILPDADNMAGPILFMGIAILDFLSADVLSSGSKNPETIALTTIIKIVLIVLFTIPLIALMIVNMIRIAMIRLWTIFSPFIVIDLVFAEKSPIKLGDKLFYKNLSELLGLIFVPAFVIGTLAIGFILMLGLVTVIKGGDQYAWTVSELQISGNPPVLAVPNVFDLSIEGNVFKPVAFRTLGFFGEVIMSIFAMLILRAMVKIGFSASSIASKRSEKVFGMARKAASVAPIIPMPGVGRTSLSAIKSQGGAGGIIRNMAGIKAMEDAAKIQGDKWAREKFGFKESVSDMSYEDMVSVQRMTGLNKLTGLRDSLVNSERTQVNYSGNIKQLFESISFEDFNNQNIFRGFNQDTFRQSRGYYELVRDVIEGNFNLTGAGSRYATQGTSGTNLSSSTFSV